jgi:hypothetical protein
MRRLTLCDSRFPYWLAAIAFLMVGCHADGSNAATDNAAMTSTKQCLQTNLEAYRSSQEKEKKYLVDYFNCFPSDFNGFKQLFGYEEKADSVSFAPLYEKYTEHVISMLPKTAEQVGKDRFLEKLINLSIGGQWQADAVGYLRSLLRQYAASDKNLFFTILERKSDKEIKSFWQFYFDGPHGLERKYDKNICPDTDRSKACKILKSVKWEKHSH